MAVTWAALGILTAFSLGVLGIMVGILGRFDGVYAKFDDVNARFDGVHAKFDDVNARFDVITTRIDRSDEARRSEISDMRSEIRALGDRLERRIDEHETRRHAG
ncbi:MAG: hypothetical protein ACRDHM_03190 [Actinomycetota bacterium]